MKNSKEKPLSSCPGMPDEHMIACVCVDCGRMLGKLGRSSRMFQKCEKCRTEMSFYTDDLYVLTIIPSWPKKAG